MISVLTMSVQVSVILVPSNRWGGIQESEKLCDIQRPHNDGELSQDRKAGQPDSGTSGTSQGREL